MNFFYAGASKTQEDTLQVFIIKIEMCKDNGGRNSKTQQINNNWQKQMQLTTETQRTTEVSKRSYNNYSGKVQILTDFLQSYSPFTLDVKSKVTAANITKKKKNTPKYPKYSRILEILKLQNNTEVSRSYTHVLQQITSD